MALLRNSGRYRTATTKRLPAAECRLPARRRNHPLTGFVLFEPDRPRRHPFRYMPAFSKRSDDDPWQDRHQHHRSRRCGEAGGDEQPPLVMCSAAMIDHGIDLPIARSSSSRVSCSCFWSAAHAASLACEISAAIAAGDRLMAGLRSICSRRLARYHPRPRATL